MDLSSLGKILARHIDSVTREEGSAGFPWERSGKSQNFAFIARIQSRSPVTRSTKITKSVCLIELGFTNLWSKIILDEREFCWIHLCFCF